MLEVWEKESVREGVWEKESVRVCVKYKLFHIDSGILYRRLAYEMEKKNGSIFEATIPQFSLDSPFISNNLN